MGAERVWLHFFYFYYHCHLSAAMKFYNIIIGLLSATPVSVCATSNSNGQKTKAGKRPPTPAPTKGGTQYEVWGCDQSNSVADATAPGQKGSLIWIWDSESIQDQLDGGADATPLSCSPSKAAGPCDLLDIFPQSLVEAGSGVLLENLSNFGRLHGLVKDPSNQYVTASIFAPGGGYVGVIDTAAKKAIALFRVTQTKGTGSGRSVHMNTWSADGSAIIVSNLDGKMVERIDVTRDGSGKITDLVFNTNAGVYLGKDFTKVADATAFSGSNTYGESLIGSIQGDYSQAGRSIKFVPLTLL